MKRLRNLEGFSNKHRRLKGLQLPLDKSTVLVNSDILFGYELEMEGFRWGMADQNEVNGMFWSIENDGSLRGEFPTELISRPMGGRTAVRNLRGVCKILNTQEDIFSYRCSTHIHMNALELDVQNLPALGLLTVLCDNAMFAAGGANRNANYNSRPISLVSQEVDAIAEFCANPEQMHVDIPREFRYMGTNWKAIDKFGTVEFRHFPGCSDAKLLIWWTNLLCRLYNAAETYPVKDLMGFAMKGQNCFGRKVFGGQFPRLEVSDEDWDDAMETAYGYMCALERPLLRDRDTLHGFMEAEYIL